jgi:hypothetical protein
MPNSRFGKDGLEQVVFLYSLESLKDYQGQAKGAQASLSESSHWTMMRQC